jgi:hypothetical protein
VWSFAGVLGRSGTYFPVRDRGTSKRDSRALTAIVGPTAGTESFKVAVVSSRNAIVGLTVALVSLAVAMPRLDDATPRFSNDVQIGASLVILASSRLLLPSPGKVARFRAGDGSNRYDRLVSRGSSKRVALALALVAGSAVGCGAVVGRTVFTKEGGGTFSCAPKEKFRGITGDLLMVVGCALLTGEGYVFMILGMPLVIADFPLSAVADLILYPIEGFWEDGPNGPKPPPKPEPAHEEAEGPARVKERSPVRALAFSPDGGSLLVATSTRAVRVWNAKNGQLFWTREARPVKSVAFSRDGRTIALGRDDDRVVWIVDEGSGTGHVEIALGQAVSPLPLAFSEDGEILYAGNEAFSVESGSRLGPIPSVAPGATVVATTSDGSLFATLGGSLEAGRIEIVDLSGRKRLAYDLEGAVHCVAFSPSGDVLAVATASKGAPHDTLRFYRTDEERHGGRVDCPRNTRVIAFSTKHPDQVALGGEGALVVLSFERERARFDTQEHAVSAAAFSPDGTLVWAMSGVDGINTW